MFVQNQIDFILDTINELRKLLEDLIMEKELENLITLAGTPKFDTELKKV